MLSSLSVPAKIGLLLAGTAAIFAFITFSPILFCQGGGAGGNCGEGLLASLPLALLLAPAFLIFNINRFFPSQKTAIFSYLRATVAWAAVAFFAASALAVVSGSHTEIRLTNAAGIHLK